MGTLKRILREQNIKNPPEMVPFETSLANMRSLPFSKDRDRALRRINNLYVESCIASATALKDEKSLTGRLSDLARITRKLLDATNECKIYVADHASQGRTKIEEHDTP
jgi:hypothetical protein